MSVREWTTARRLIAICAVGMVTFSLATLVVGMVVVSRTSDEGRAAARRWARSLAEETAVEVNTRFRGVESVLASQARAAAGVNDRPSAVAWARTLLEADDAFGSVEITRSGRTGAFSVRAGRDADGEIIEQPNADGLIAPTTTDLTSGGTTWRPVGFDSTRPASVRVSTSIASEDGHVTRIAIELRLDVVTNERERPRTPNTSVFLLQSEDKTRVNGVFRSLSGNAGAIGPWRIATGNQTHDRTWERARVRDDLEVSGESLVAADKPIGLRKQELGVLLVLVPLSDLIDYESLVRGKWVMIGCGILSGLWGLGSIILLGVHGAWPTALTVTDEEEQDDFAIGDSEAGTDGDLDWAIVSVQISATEGGGLSLDGSADDHSQLLDHLESIAAESDVKVLGRMPDRLLAAEIMGHSEIPAGQTAAAFAIAARNVLAESVLARPMSVTVGIAGGSIGEREASGAWGRAAIRAAEALSETREEGAILATGRVAEHLRAAFVLESRGSFWIDGVGSGEVWYLRGRR